MKLRRVVLVALGVALLAVFVAHAGPTEIAHHLRQAGFGIVLLLLLSLAWHSAAAVGMWLLIPDRAVRLRNILALRLAGEAVNTLTPFLSLGGEPVKVAWLRRWVGVERATAYVLLDKTVYWLASLLFMATGLAVGIWVLSGHWAAIAIATSILAAWSLGVGLLVRRQAQGDAASALVRLLRKLRINVSDERAQQITRIDATMSSFWGGNRRRFLGSLAMHFIGRALRIVDVVLVSLLVGAPLGWASSWFLAAVAVLVNTAFSFIPGALGAYEGGHAYVFTLLGSTSAVGVAVGLTRRIRTWVFAGLSYLLVVVGPDIATAPNSHAES